MIVLKYITYVLNYINFFVLYLVIYKDWHFLAGILLAPFTFSIVYFYLCWRTKKINFDMLSGILLFYLSLIISFLYLFSLIGFVPFVYIQFSLFIILVIDTFF